MFHERWVIISLILCCGIHHSIGARPGKCTKQEDCGNGLTCVAVQTSVEGIEKASQCVPGNTCTGNTPGKCPTFSSWPSKYRNLEIICAPRKASNCVNAENSTDSDSDTVDCYNFPVINGNETKNVLAIYSCVDKNYYMENMVYSKNITEEQFESCKGNSEGTGKLCNGQGTCRADTAFGVEFSCECNLGYSSNDNCFEASSNSCDNFGQCGVGGECNTGQNQCECKDGATGFQCSECDANAEVVCNGYGACENGKCKCNEESGGTFCEEAALSSMGNVKSINYIFQLIIGFVFACLY